MENTAETQDMGQNMNEWMYVGVNQNIKTSWNNKTQAIDLHAAQGKNNNLQTQLGSSSDFNCAHLKLILQIFLQCSL